MNIKRFIIPIIAIFLASLNLRPVITSVSPLLGTIRQSLNMSATSASLLTSLPVLCMGFFAPVAVKLANRWSIERAIAYSLILIGVATAARYYAFSSWVMLITAFLTGIGIAIIGPLLSGFIKQKFPNPSRIVGIYSLALVVGAALGSGFSIPLRTLFNNSWQTSVASWSILALVAIFFWWKPVRNEPKLAHDESITDLSRSEKNGLKLVLTNKKAWILTSFFGVMAFMFYSITAWLPPIVEDMGYNKQAAAMMLTLLTLVQMPASLLIPILISRFQNRVAWLIGCSVMELIGLLTLLFSVTPWISSVFLGIGAGGLFSLGLILPIDEASNTKEASILAAMTQSVGYIFAALGPIFVGSVRDYAGSFTPAIIGMIVVVVVMILIQFKIGNKKASDDSSA
ncbi:MFS transporter [Paenibacillus larvae]